LHGILLRTVQANQRGNARPVRPQAGLVPGVEHQVKRRFFERADEMVGCRHALGPDDIVTAAFLAGRAFIVEIDFAFADQWKWVVNAGAVPVVGTAGWNDGPAERAKRTAGRVGLGDGDGAGVTTFDDRAVSLVVKIVLALEDEDIWRAIRAPADLASGRALDGRTLLLPAEAVLADGVPDFGKVPVERRYRVGCLVRPGRRPFGATARVVDVVSAVNADDLGRIAAGDVRLVGETFEPRILEVAEELVAAVLMWVSNIVHALHRSAEFAVVRFFERYLRRECSVRVRFIIVEM